MSKRTNNDPHIIKSHNLFSDHFKKLFSANEVSAKRQTLKITYIYFVIGSLWILLSDKLVDFLIKERATVIVISIVKGWVYVFLTSILIFLLVFSALKKVLDSEDKIRKMNDELEKKVLERTAQIEETTAELEETNAILEEEIVERQKAEENVKKLNNELENKVILRTRQLEETNGILDKANNILSAILESSPEIIVFALDCNYCYLAFNIKHQDIMRAIWGKEIEIGMNMLDVIGRHEGHKKSKINFDLALGGESFTLIEKYGNEKLSRLFWQDFYSPIFSTEGNVIGLTCFVLNVTECKRAEEALKESESRLIAAQLMAHVGNWELNLDTKNIWASEEAFNIYGIEYISPYLPFALVQESVFPEYRESLDTTLIGLITKNEKYDVEFKIKNAKTGEEQFAHSKAILLVDETGNASKVVGTIQDITEQKKKEVEILYLSYHDQLTGLYNRRFYEEELKRLDTGRNLPMTIVLGDVNGLKFINDSFGHLMGDELLKKVAEVITKGCRADDIIARLGGDEFVILLPKTDSYEAEQIVKRIKAMTLSEKVGSIDISISFGWEIKNNEEEKIHEIFKKAEDHMYKKKLFEGPSMRGKTINAIINTLHEKNKREEQHSHRVSAVCKSIGEALGLPEHEIEELKSVGLLHDIGKTAIDENVLNKPGKLTDDEWEEIKRHPEIGYRILSTVNDMYDMADYILYHHERWDGRGYPKGLKGDEIPFVSRIITIADAYDAMTSERSYRSALPEEVAIKELQKNAGIQFDPELVSVFIEKVLG